MNRFALIRHNNASELSIISRDGLSVDENINLPSFPFDKDERVFGGVCGPWSYFHGHKGVLVVCNLMTMTSNQFRVFPPPPDLPLDRRLFRASGLGYVAKSNDYKVIRYYLEYHLKTAHEDGEDGLKMYDGCTDHFEVCFLQRSPSSWKVIKGPDTRCSIESCAGVYVNVTGRCYWTASYDLDHHECELRREVAWSGASPYSQFYLVVSFDFATERFHQLPLPATALGEDLHYKLVGCRGLLGVLVYDDINPSPSGLSIQLHVWSLKKRSWKLLYALSHLDHVARPITGLKDNRFMYLESKPSGGRCQLLAYDLKAKTEKKLDIYDRPGYMDGFSYAECSGPPLPDSRRKKSRKVKKRKPRH